MNSGGEKDRIAFGERFALDSILGMAGLGVIMAGIAGHLAVLVQYRRERA